ncbi:PREDICTED: SKP1-like protein 11 [Nicotiana attenuata]|uniref:SKP1-like protein 11 n=1 Tax=Nicotiana attenuata TaxID=49451 RepID=UPI000904CF6C|nr:PREDICTED: SKP1-like protein 11 [Nicotiana attenuata]
MAEAASSTTEKRFLTLKSSDGDEFELEESIAIQSIHSSTSSNEEDIENFDKEFVSIGFKTIFIILEAANFLDIYSLLELCAEAVDNLIKNKTLEAIWKIFIITSDFTPEEEAEIRNETPWAFEGDLDHSLD